MRSPTVEMDLYNSTELTTAPTQSGIHIGRQRVENWTGCERSNRVWVLRMHRVSRRHTIL